MKKDAELNAEKDKKEKEEVEIINQADSMIFQTEKSMNDLEDKLTKNDKNEITSFLEELKDSHKSKDIEKIKSSMEKVNQTFQKITQNLYNQSTESGGQDYEVSDVDFEEVKQN
jgi:molecular chaperone DnaK